MFLLGTLLGFVGLGGGGFVSALLILLFHIPTHLAFATSLGAMFATSVFGGWSHLREGNVDPVSGVQIGLLGMLGAYLGGGLALATGATELKLFSGLILIANSVMIYWRTNKKIGQKNGELPLAASQSWKSQLPSSFLIGLPCGVISGYFAIGAAPWVQLGLLVAKGTNLARTIGTAMFALGLMSLSGAVRYAQGGEVSLPLLLSVVAGISAGSFLGAKFTKRAPRSLVRTALLITPCVAGSLLILAPA